MFHKRKKIRFIARSEDAFITGLKFVVTLIVAVTCSYIIVAGLLIIFAGY